jgi:hypothetical protein
LDTATLPIIDLYRTVSFDFMLGFRHGLHLDWPRKPKTTLALPHRPSMTTVNFSAVLPAAHCGT